MVCTPPAGDKCSTGACVNGACVFTPVACPSTDKCLVGKCRTVTWNYNNYGGGDENSLPPITGRFAG